VSECCLVSFAWLWKVAAFLLTWLVLGLIFGWGTGSAAKLGGEEDDR
jgi:hypothetical protein